MDETNGEAQKLREVLETLSERLKGNVGREISIDSLAWAVKENTRTLEAYEKILSGREGLVAVVSTQGKQIEQLEQERARQSDRGWQMIMLLVTSVISIGLALMALVRG